MIGAGTSQVRSHPCEVLPACPLALGDDPPGAADVTCAPGGERALADHRGTADREGEEGCVAATHAVGCRFAPSASIVPGDGPRIAVRFVVREDLTRRSTTPFVDAAPYHEAGHAPGAGRSLRPMKSHEHWSGASSGVHAPDWSRFGHVGP
jgi:hypothetical protein